MARRRRRGLHVRVPAVGDACKSNSGCWELGRTQKSAEPRGTESAFSVFHPRIKLWRRFGAERGRKGVWKAGRGHPHKGAVRPSVGRNQLAFSLLDPANSPPTLRLPT